MDTSGPMAANCADVLVLRPRRKERPKDPRMLHDDGELSYLSRLGLPKVGLPHC